MTDSDKIGIGFVGAGWMGRALLERILERDECELRWLCQRDRQRGTATLEELGLSPSRYTDRYAEMLADPAVDAVFLCTPNALHGAQAIAALTADKHVFCEKPCATTYTEYAQQLELAREKPELVTLCDYILYFDPMEQRLRRLVEDGAFGTISQVQVNYRHPVNIAGDKAWKLDRDTIGDAIGMGIIHALWAMVHAMAPQTRPTSVFATSAPAQVRPFEVDPIWTIQVRFENGASGVCFGNIDTGVGYDAYHSLHGTEGAFVFDSLAEHARKIRYHSMPLTDGKPVWPLDAARCRDDGFGSLAFDDTSTPDSGDVWKHQTAECVAHFVECVRDGRQSPLSFESTSLVAELGWAAQVSAVERRPVDVPLSADDARVLAAR